MASAPATILHCSYMAGSDLTFKDTTPSAKVYAVNVTAPGGSFGTNNHRILEITVTDTAPPNNPLTANAGPDQDAPEGSTVNLNGTVTGSDPEDDLTYSWSHNSTLAMTLDNSTALDTYFTAPDVDSDTPVEFTLEVSDGTDTVTDKVTVTIQDSPNTAPTVNAGPDQTVTENMTVSMPWTASVYRRRFPDVLVVAEPGPACHRP